mmetsp:Transcript_8745/g.23601  ORF Transcript_8745/g.23601 Transcript_8745/m.23601 type:complete len:262 (-) Transcript_8745:1357-2142(-)|eukprot:CAMPEP_0198108734 /NCGR_PEP_ID=MMETSP1442-20131203/772_1 /TAXON_ID= /ORGANISM="Craspedostauros australis, Strain CCMP3328" /LENGTH=261 /DNA_ID=CAMNT_0043764091 /DNA_START=75 /DNA_END=860 /DNA_ORIENTATION=+
MSTISRTFLAAIVVVSAALAASTCEAWTVPSTTMMRCDSARQTNRQTATMLFATPPVQESTPENGKESIQAAADTVKVQEKDNEKDNDDNEKDNDNNEKDNNDNNDDDDEFEYIEYDVLSEAEFRGSEWAVGTVQGENVQNQKVKETWVRLAADKDGKNIAIWGDGSQGTWAFDVASQFISISKEKLWGKNIWACVVDDYYYLQGSVRGWTFLTPASVTGQWQARRLGVDPEEAGEAPWFEPEEPEESTDIVTKEDEEKKS